MHVTGEPARLRRGKRPWKRWSQAWKAALSPSRVIGSSEAPGASSGQYPPTTFPPVMKDRSIEPQVRDADSLGVGRDGPTGGGTTAAHFGADLDQTALG